MHVMAIANVLNLFNDMRESIPWYRFNLTSPFRTASSQIRRGTINNIIFYLGTSTEALAASAAALARPCRASIGAFMLDRGKVSSDSSSEDAAVEGTMPYVAYL